MRLISRIVFKLRFIYNKWVNIIYSKYATIRLKNKEFTVICNNCFGGHLYEATNRPYNTPTVGLYFFAEDYIKFISNIEDYLKEDLKFILKSRFEECKKEHKAKKYPIGVLSNNLEIHFLHYKTEQEAESKWNRRKERVEFENLLIIMNDQNRFSDKLMPQFDAIKCPKVFLSSKQRQGNNVKVISYYKGKDCVGDMYNDKIKCFKDFDLVSWIKNQK
ncbi:uncharacterized protein DUF1919 [Winogradskyella pacifica]|uniref:Uncharacterized protein DUF1919 n=1 Tax=Winogradskyella pacifica TaxID=664642 RepID=A0A3D9N5Q4_9FLAO|nr:DUF1919 domain-containing protein [Winogradskyella pacifica]REE27453.1 uncharacterized protein DUF1919 [Winogradskyella pacifica]